MTTHTQPPLREAAERRLRHRVMRRARRRALELVPLLLLLAPSLGCTQALGSQRWTATAGGAVIPTRADSTRDAPVAAPPDRPRSRADSLEWVAARRRAARATGLRVVVSLFDRRLWVIDGVDTLRSAPVAVASGKTLRDGERVWRFVTPRGHYRVLRKDENPVWIPPDWHYIELARERGYRVARLSATRPRRLADGSRLVVRDSLVGVVPPGEEFMPLPVDEHVVFDRTLFIPPLGSLNRRIPGELGRFRLDMGDGYQLHGTSEEESIGTRSTHGCVRLYDEDIEWLYYNVPVGTSVYFY